MMEECSGKASGRKWICTGSLKMGEFKKVKDKRRLFPGG